jgi:hypothetical protein
MSKPKSTSYAHNVHHQPRVLQLLPIHHPSRRDLNPYTSLFTVVRTVVFLLDDNPILKFFLLLPPLLLYSFFVASIFSIHSTTNVWRGWWLSRSNRDLASCSRAATERLFVDSSQLLVQSIAVAVLELPARMICRQVSYESEELREVAYLDGQSFAVPTAKGTSDLSGPCARRAAGRYALARGELDAFRALVGRLRAHVRLLGPHCLDGHVVGET